MTSPNKQQNPNKQKTESQSRRQSVYQCELPDPFKFAEEHNSTVAATTTISTDSAFRLIDPKFTPVQTDWAQKCKSNASFFPIMFLASAMGTIGGTAAVAWYKDESVKDLLETHATVLAVSAAVIAGLGICLYALKLWHDAEKLRAHEENVIFETAAPASVYRRASQDVSSPPRYVNP